MSWDFFGSKGHMHMFANGTFQITLARNKQPEPAVDPLPEMNHYANFVQAVRTRDRGVLNAEIHETHISTALCHLGNISYRLGRELHFDPSSGTFPNDAEANKLLTRAYRSPYVVPEKL